MDERKEHWVLSEIDVSVFPSCFQIVNLLHILYINVNLCKQIFFFFKFWQTLFFSFSLFFSKAEKNGKKKRKRKTPSKPAGVWIIGPACIIQAHMHAFRYLTRITMDAEYSFSWILDLSYHCTNSLSCFFIFSLILWNSTNQNWKFRILFLLSWEQ